MMKFDIRLVNCLWLILPILIWNILLGPRIKDARITSDNFSPKWLLIAENSVRIFVFMLPLLMPLQLNDVTSKTGFWVYSVGTLIYFASCCLSSSHLDPRGVTVQPDCWLRG
jgi:hypothetical protein